MRGRGASMLLCLVEVLVAVLFFEVVGCSEIDIHVVFFTPNKILLCWCAS